MMLRLLFFKYQQVLQAGVIGKEAADRKRPAIRAHFEIDFPLAVFKDKGIFFQRIKINARRGAETGTQWQRSALEGKTVFPSIVYKFGLRGSIIENDRFFALAFLQPPFIIRRFFFARHCGCQAKE